MSNDILKFGVLGLIVGIFIILSSMLPMFGIVETMGNTTIIGTNNNAVDVYIQDQHTELIDLKLARHLDNLTLLNNYSIGERTIIVETTGVVPIVKDTICLKENSAFYQAQPVTITPLGGNQYQLLMDTPLDYPFSTDGGCALTNTDLNVDGSVTPVIFSVTPDGLVNSSWDITRFIMIFGGEGIGATKEAPDDADFGVTGMLTNGIVLRSVNGITKNIFNAKTNGHLRARAYDVTYTEKAKNGLYTVATRRTFAGANKNGVTIRLNSETADSFELIIQDDLTDMYGGMAVVQGHIVD